MKRAAIIAALLGACERRSAITSCDSDLRGVWRTESGEPWMILDGGAALEIYPLFDDATPENPPAAIVVAPRVIDLGRSAAGVRGEVHRRYMQGADACDATLPARLVTCTDRTVEIVLADPSPPLGFTPCSWGRANSSRRERWRR